MSQFLTFLFIIAVLVFGYVLFGQEKVPPKEEKKSSVKEEVVKEEVTRQEVFTGEPSSNTSKFPQEKSVSAVSEVSQFALDIQAPTVDMTVASPFLVQGRVKGGNSLVVRILHSSRKILIEEKINLKTASDSDGYRPFQMKLTYLFTNTKEGFLEFVLMDEKGEAKNTQEVALKFL